MINLIVVVLTILLAKNVALGTIHIVEIVDIEDHVKNAHVDILNGIF